MAYRSDRQSSRIVRLAMVSSFIPRACGIATFADDLLGALHEQAIDGHVFAVEGASGQYLYDPRVVGTFTDTRAGDYGRVAAEINTGDFELLNVQHEFGLYGGDTSDALAQMLAAVDIPVVTTLHTIPGAPPARVRRTLRGVCRYSDVVVVMNALAVGVLARVYTVPRRKVTVIHHGAPTVSRARLRTVKDDLDLAGRTVICTFGLLSPNKGLEYAIAALPAIVAARPDVLYLILGTTHPEVKRQHGDGYRAGLEALAAELGVAAHVRFIDKFFTKAELVAYLSASDLYLTPYLQMEQVTSGTLAYAMACGRPIVSTPYLHARYLVTPARGVLVPPRDAAAIADACVTILGDRALRSRMAWESWRYGQTMTWPEVGGAYRALFLDAVERGRAARYSCAA